MADDEAMTTVTPKQLEGLLRSGTELTVLDIRRRDEFDTWHVTGPAITAVQASHAKFVAAQITGSVAGYAESVGVDPDDRVIVVCAKGKSSRQVAAMLADAGIDAGSLESGLQGWARLSRTDRVTESPATIGQYRRPATGCLSYLVVDDRKAAVVDPLRTFAEQYAADATAMGAEIAYVVDTHVHADHVSGVRTVAESTGAEPVLPAGARERGLDFDARLVEDGETLALDDVGLEAVELPGHTSEMTGLRLGDHLLCGDSVFPTSVARPDLEAGDEGAPELARTLFETLRRVADMPDGTTLLPGHYGDPTVPKTGPYAPTVGTVRERVAALSMDEESFVRHVTEDLPPRPANFERIIAANLGTDELDDRTAFEVELGPNSCAVS